MADEERLLCPACAAEWPTTMRFCGACGTPILPVSLGDSELRQLTILFCDMVGSTELSTQIDAEALAEVMRDYYVMCDRVITDAGGYVVKFHGDGVLACFGAPIALDDAPFRAVKAAWDLVADTASMVDPSGAPLTARAGVHTGRVVVGATGAGTGLASLDVLGEAANLASRLQGAAAPGTVIISADTASLVPPHVELVDGVDLTLKGINRPIRAYRVEGVGDPIDELHSRARANEATLVAREAELAILLGRCHLAAQGSPQYAVLVGEPGIGKSRLLRELRDSPARPPGRVVVVRGLQDRSTSPFAPLLDLVARHGSELPAILEADLASLLRPERLTGDLDTPDRRRRRSIDAVCDGLLALTEEALLVLILDDLHWFDPSTLELLGVLRDRAADSRLAVLATARPEWTSPWMTAGDVTTLQLPRLGPDAIRRMLAELEIDDDDLIAKIVERSEGVPLFLEEYVRQRRAGADSEMQEVPHTVADLLRARLERLGPDLEFARECSVFGRDIDVEVAAGALGAEPDAMRARLRGLVGASVLRERFRGRTFSFQHVLLRDAAYESLLRARRVPLHRAAAESIVALGPTARAQFAEQLARHWTAAGAHDEAFSAWIRAARLAVDRNALSEAMSHYTIAREVLQLRDPGTGRDRDEVRLILSQGQVAVRVLGGGHPSVSEMYERAEELCIGEDDPTHLARVMLGLYSFWVSKPDLDKAQANLPRLLQTAEELPSTGFLAYFFAGSTMHLQGRFDEACEFLEHSAALMLQEDGRMSNPLAVLSYGLLGDMANRRDRPRSAEWYGRAFEVLEQFDRPPFETAWLELAFAKSLAFRDDIAGAALHAGTAADLGSQFGLAQVSVQAECLLAWVDAVLMGGDEPIERMQSIFERFDTCGSRAESSLYLVFLTRALRTRGRNVEAADVLARLEAYVTSAGERLNCDAMEAERAALTLSR